MPSMLPLLEVLILSADYDISFAVTYINGYGESSISDWGDKLTLPEHHSEDDGVSVRPPVAHSFKSRS